MEEREKHTGLETPTYLHLRHEFSGSQMRHDEGRLHGLDNGSELVHEGIACGQASDHTASKNGGMRSSSTKFRPAQRTALCTSRFHWAYIYLGFHAASESVEPTVRKVGPFSKVDDRHDYLHITVEPISLYAI